MSKTLGNMLNKIQLQRQVAYATAKADILKRNNLTERDLQGKDGTGPRWQLEEVEDSRTGADDMVGFRLYELKDATTVYIEGKVRTVVEDGIENIPEIKNYPRE